MWSLALFESLSLTIIFSPTFTFPEPVGLGWTSNCKSICHYSQVNTHTQLQPLILSQAQPFFFSVSHSLANLTWTVFRHRITCSHILCLRHKFGFTAIFSHTINFSHICSHDLSWCDSLAWTVSHTIHLPTLSHLLTYSKFSHLHTVPDKLDHTFMPVGSHTLFGSLCLPHQ